MNSNVGKGLYLAGIGSLILVLLMGVMAIGRQAPWEDEIFAVSTGWSIARSQPPILSVLAQYPQTGSPVRFYGPISFEAEAFLIRIFGLSLLSWRLVCFAGVILSLLVCWALVRVAGGDRWAGLITALVIALSASLAGPLPGRWDAVTCGLFLGGILLFLLGAEQGGKALVGRVGMAGVLIGFALASSPRSLTLALAALVAALLVALCFRRLWKRFLLGSLGMFAVAALVQTLLLLPWGQTSFSWYTYLREATKKDRINATPLAGQGTWTLDAHHHKTVLILCALLLLISVYGALTEPGSRPGSGRLPFKVFLTLFAAANISLMILLVANPLGSAAFWLPPAVAALTCWVDWEFARNRSLGMVSVFVVGICLLLLLVQEAQQMAAVVLTWNQRSTPDLKAFVEKTLPEKAVVYGPIGGYFYPVELSGRQYLYVYEQTTPGLYSEPRGSVGDKLDSEICTHPAFAMWPKPDQLRSVQEQTMPDALHHRLQNKVGEFDQPPLTPWREKMLARIGEIGGKYGFSDAVIYSLKSLTPCANR